MDLKAKNIWPVALKLVLAIIFFFGINEAKAQFSGKIDVAQQEMDLGEIGIGHNRYADFVLVNNGSDVLYFLRTDKPEDIVVRFSSPQVEPGATATIRIKHNPERRGSFIRKTLIYTSAANEPLVLTVKGNVKQLEDNMDISCPNFNMTQEETRVENSFKVQVIDKQSRLPIQNAQVYFKPNNLFRPFLLTNSEGMVSAKVPIGLYDIWAEAKYYYPDSIYMYVGKNTSGLILILDKRPDAPKDSGRIIIAENEVETVEEYVEKPGELPVSSYKPNNVVFLIDVSSSMASPEKMPLLKIAMKQMLGPLREIDQISIVTYADGTDVLMNGEPVKNKDGIAKKIDKLTPKGTTQGGKGIREAYRIAQRNFIKGGNNQIILATDGDFNLEKSDDALFELIRENNRKGITLSVVGFGGKKRAIEKMEKLASTGQGSYLHIANEEQAMNALVDEIKLRAKK